MSQTNDDRRAIARNKAQTHFTSAEQRDAVLRKDVENEHAKTIAKTARLRALRLAKEAAEKEEARRLAAASGKPAVKKQRARRRMKRASVN